jgi:hypothetical protein
MHLHDHSNSAIHVPRETPTNVARIYNTNETTAITPPLFKMQK